MKTLINNETYFISWVHSTKGTVCNITKEGFVPFVNGESILAHGDRMNKKIGRHISLTRALKNTNWNKQQRKNIWDSYLSTQKK